MIEISVADALLFAEEHFPHAPEKLAEFLKIEVEFSSFVGDGWCLQYGENRLIRINSDIADVRKKFTLAHELGHFIYDEPAVVGESVSYYVRKSRIERQIDTFAAALLLPKSKVLEYINQIPITAKAINRLARKARVSDSVVALRIAELKEEFALSDVSVLLYKDDVLVWQRSKTLQITEEYPGELIEQCAQSPHNLARIPQPNNKVVVASFIENPTAQTKTVFLQLLDETIGGEKLLEEQRRELEKELFADEPKLRQILSGKFGGFKSRAKKMDYESAVELFNQEIDLYPGNLTQEHLLIVKSAKGQKYIRLKLKY